MKKYASVLARNKLKKEPKSQQSENELLGQSESELPVEDKSYYALPPEKVDKRKKHANAGRIRRFDVALNLTPQEHELFQRFFRNNSHVPKSVWLRSFIMKALKEISTGDKSLLLEHRTPPAGLALPVPDIPAIEDSEPALRSRR